MLPQCGKSFFAHELIFNHMNRDFKGIWIPKEIWLAEELTLQEKVLLVEIDSLNCNNSGCFATNEYFANFFSISKDSVSRLINSLVKKGFVRMELDQKSGNIRKLFTLSAKMPIPLSAKMQIPIGKNADHNNTYNNIDYINNNIMVNSFKEIVTELRKSESWIHLACKSTNETAEEILKDLDSWEEYVLASDDLSKIKNINEARKYFVNWVRYQKSKGIIKRSGVVNSSGNRIIN